MSACRFILSTARANLQAALTLLQALQHYGLQRLVLCPGSRSGPLALAAGLLASRHDLSLTTAVDERSAAFLALGLATAAGRAVAVVTTSGTAVANLLPATVEADRSTQPLLLLSADRPLRLKNCGANQTVNQEQFLAPACRWVWSGAVDGLHGQSQTELSHLASEAWLHAHGTAGWAPGPVHLNLAFEEPLHASAAEQQQLLKESPQSLLRCPVELSSLLPSALEQPASPCPVLDSDQPGVVVAGPWRGLASRHSAYQAAVQQWLKLSGWPLLADPLAALPVDLEGRIVHWDLLLDELKLPPECQVLRLGPIPSSRRLETWLQHMDGPQLLITEGESRCLDPLKRAQQWHGGVVRWLAEQMPKGSAPALDWHAADRWVSKQLDQLLPGSGSCSEPALARRLAKLLPPGLPVMLAASSPVRDWLSWGGLPGIDRRCFSFRGASGIDGTLSLAVGLSLQLGAMVLVTGDLALLHDSNGWLQAAAEGPSLLVLLIDNAGGGIFEQLPIETNEKVALEQLFVMPQQVDPLALAAAHGVPGRSVACMDDLAHALEWGLAQNGAAILRIRTSRDGDAQLRNGIRAQIKVR